MPLRGIAFLHKKEAIPARKFIKNAQLTNGGDGSMIGT